MTSLTRALAGLVWAVAVLCAIGILAGTEWASTRSPGSTSPFDGPTDPAVFITGALLVCIPSVLLVQTAWKRLRPPRRGPGLDYHPGRGRR